MCAGAASRVRRADHVVAAVDADAQSCARARDRRQMTARDDGIDAPSACLRRGGARAEHVTGLIHCGAERPRGARDPFEPSRQTERPALVDFGDGTPHRQHRPGSLCRRCAERRRGAADREHAERRREQVGADAYGSQGGDPAHGVLQLMVAVTRAIPGRFAGRCAAEIVRYSASAANSGARRSTKLETPSTKSGAANDRSIASSASASATGNGCSSAA
jgi:hypothetical protein